MFMHHFLMQLVCDPAVNLLLTAIDGLLFLVGFSTASARLIPQLFLQGLYTALMSYTHYCITFYLPHLLWTPACKKVKEQLGL